MPLFKFNYSLLTSGVFDFSNEATTISPSYNFAPALMIFISSNVFTFSAVKLVLSYLDEITSYMYHFLLLNYKIISFDSRYFSLVHIHINMIKSSWKITRCTTYSLIVFKNFWFLLERFYL